MIVAQKVRTTQDANGNARRGWLVYHVKGDQATYIGFISVGDFQWSEIRKALPGIAYLGQMDTTPEQYAVLLSNRIISLENTGAVAQAMDGN